LPWRFLPVVNGKIAPYLEVEPRTYRFRVLNGCTYRTLGLTLSADSTNIPIFQIGTENGFLSAPVRIGDPGEVRTLRLMPGERADIMVDFSPWPGATNIVVTNFFSPGNFGLPPSVPPELVSATNVVGGLFMKFIVKDMDPSSTNPVPTHIEAFHEPAEDLAQHAIRTRTNTLDLRNELLTDELPAPIFETDPHVFALLNLAHFNDPVTETPRLGDVEIWEFINLTSEAHPMHVHLLDFLVLSRSRFLGFTGSRTNVPSGVRDYIRDRRANQLQDLNAYLDPANVPPVSPYEKGPKDTVHAAPWGVTRIVMRWPSDLRFVGPYVYHCHILDHEDNDMMRPIQMLPPLEMGDLAPGMLRLGFDSVQREFLVQLGTIAGALYDVQASSNLVDWSHLGSLLGDGTPNYLVDPLPPGTTNTSARMYRALIPPPSSVAPR
jgi:spore coat protein A